MLDFILAMLDFILMLFNSLLLGLRARSVLQARDHRIAPSIDRAATKPKTKAARPQSRRSLPVGLAVASVVGLAFLLNHREAGNRHRLASSRIPLVLDLEDSSRAIRASSSSEGNSRSDSNNEQSE